MVDAAARLMHQMRVSRSPRPPRRSPVKKSPKARKTWDRRKNPARREDLLQRFVDDLLAHGFFEFSLSTSARRMGTSARMLLHYFGSKEQLVTEALRALRARYVQMALGGDHPMSGFEERFWRTWNRFTTGDFMPLFRLTYEVLWVALRRPERYREFLEQMTAEWQIGFAATLESAGLSARDARSMSTAFLGAMRGLLVDLAVTGDLERVTDAAGVLARNLRMEMERLITSARAKT